MKRRINILELAKALQCGCGCRHDQDGATDGSRGFDIPFSTEVAVQDGKLGTVRRSGFGYDVDLDELILCNSCGAEFSLSQALPAERIDELLERTKQIGLCEVDELQLDEE